MGVTHVLVDGGCGADPSRSIQRTCRLDDIAAAHAGMEAGRATGKLVVRP